jgi:glycerol-3-phosphate acyltransferase PlsY
MHFWLSFPVFGLLGYLIGSLPFSLWVTRMVRGVDVRKAGSGHATATNTFRQAGWFAGVAVLLLDLSKGFAPTFLALHYGSSFWVAPLTAGLAVVGHCWPIFAQFRGGMGLATAGGTFFAVSPLGFALSLGVLVALVLILHHAARASVVAGVLAPVVMWLFRLGDPVVWVAVAVGTIIAFRFLRDWHRQYRELWLDRGEIE